MSLQIQETEFYRHATPYDPSADLSVHKTLLESTKAIPWKIDWASMSFEYIGPQIEDLLGWEQDSWKSVDDWAARMHPDDREYVVNFCVSQSQAGVDHEADYRAMTKDGGYVWIRDVVHVIRKPDGEVDCLVGFMLDISERKEMEQKLQAAQVELQRLSFEDSLTGIANRRRFEVALQSAWDAACASGAPLSMMLFDIDYFKQYNDYYGHIGGDACLKAFAQLLKDTVDGQWNLVARFGGEEFVVLLPNTDAAKAQQLADQYQKHIAQARIPHEKSNISAFLTASVGIGTIMPTADQVAGDFINAVDALLYKAKQNGRNQAVCATV